MLDIGAAVEVQIRGATRVTTTYYFFGSQRVAMRVTTGTITGTVTWLHGDHLGSASLATNATGAKVVGSDARYTPFGEYRAGLAGAGNASDNRFTGQKRLTAGWGLDDFNARFYSAALARFGSADTIVPQAGDPQALNRHSYAHNRPLALTDPSGHCPICMTGKTSTTPAFDTALTVNPASSPPQYSFAPNPVHAAAPDVFVIWQFSYAGSLSVQGKVSAGLTPETLLGSVSPIGPDLETALEHQVSIDLLNGSISDKTVDKGRIGARIGPAAAGIVSSQGVAQPYMTVGIGNVTGIEFNLGQPSQIEFEAGIGLKGGVSLIGGLPNQQYIAMSQKGFNTLGRQQATERVTLLAQSKFGHSYTPGMVYEGWKMRWNYVVNAYEFETSDFPHLRYVYQSNVLRR